MLNQMTGLLIFPYSELEPFVYFKNKFSSFVKLIVGQLAKLSYKYFFLENKIKILPI